ncbi:MAG: Smr/MutS family protein [Pseudomonadota bacterium]
MEDSIGFKESVKIPVEDSIDLHTFSPRDIPSLLEEYIKECINKGIIKVRIIHGKGVGVQRDIVHSFLEKNPQVYFFSQAPPEAGGWGATIAILKEK